jgi:PLP dependent protein
MGVDRQAYHDLKEELLKRNVSLVAVSKTKPPADILEMYELGQKDFGENYVQEMCDKQGQLPFDIRWHFIGHLQSNKIKSIAPFVHLIHGVDSFKLLCEINKHALKIDRVIRCLLQVHIAEEETKFGFSEAELAEIWRHPDLKALKNIQIAGLMGMASFSSDETKIRKEFERLRSLFDKYRSMDLANANFELLSMGMSADYQIAIELGSNMVRIGSLLFGSRP